MRTRTICRIKKSSYYMFSFCEVSAGHDMAADAGKIPRTGANSKYLRYKKHKNTRAPKNMGFNRRPFEEFRRKTKKNYTLGMAKHPTGT